MSRFQDALLAELVTHVETRADDVPSPRRTSRVRRGVATVAVTTVIAALLAGLSAWLTPSAAYALTEDPDGTITITFHDLTDAEALNRDLRAHGAGRVRAIGVDELPACSATAPARPGARTGIGRAVGGTDPAIAPWGVLTGVDGGEPLAYFFADRGTPDRRIARQTRNELTIDPAAIPPSQVAVVVVMDALGHQSRGAYGALYLLPAPGPTCMVGGRPR
ncbi:hypothetical protein [Cryptosporangium phraense]|uniref:Uncharacterized protein n=1 Tax=Cryptosporangium phraense TaxID=2593070 RepID=A0A545AKC5_9ACTN|nr:hypothetical protein [Cryptosporangium phraense]TQS41776.1 hypothetical protein FL583_27440 [Cryptosporangium phraense]